MSYNENIGIEIKLTGADEAGTSIDNLTAKLQNLQTAINNVKSTNLTTTMKSVSKATTTTDSSLKSLTSTLKKLVSFATISKIVDNVIDKSTQYDETLNYVSVSLGEYAEEALNYANVVNSVYGIDQANWLSYQSVFANLTSGFGLASDQVAIMSQQMTQLGYDISSLVGESMNLTTKQVMQKLQSGLAGEIEPVRRLGYDLSKANLELIAANLGITKQFSEMTQAEKVQLRYYALMTQLTDVQGDFGKTLETPANMMKVLKENTSQLSRSLGNILIPLIKAILPVAIAVVQVLKSAADVIAAFFGYEAPEVSGMSNAVDVTSAISSNLDDASGTAAKLKKQLAGFDEINNLTTNTGTSGSGDDYGGSSFNIDLPTYDFLSKSTGFQAKIDKIKKSLQVILPIIVAIATAISTIATLTGANKIGKILLSGLSTGNLIVTVITTVISLLVSLYATCEPFRNWVNNLFSSISKWWSGTLKPFFANVIDFWKQFSQKGNEVLTSIFSHIVNVIQWIIDIPNKLSSMWNTVKTAIKTLLVDMLLGYFTTDLPYSIKNMISSVMGFVAEVAGKIGSVLITPLKNVFKNFINWLLSGIEGGINGIIKGINSMIGTINRKLTFTIPSWVPLFGGKKWSSNIGYLSSVNLPRLATGGIVTQETIATIGENGAEAVIPLERNTGWMNALATKVNSTSDSNTEDLLIKIIDVLSSMDLTVSLDGEKIANNTIAKINSRNRLQGKSVITV